MEPAKPGDNILAFRTITTMLNVLRDGPIGHKPAYLRNTGHSKKLELRTLNAIATLLVRQHEVTSVASKTKWLGVDLIACAMVRNQDTWFGGDLPIPRKTSTKVPNDSLNYSGEAPRIIALQVPVQIDLDNPLLYVRETWGAQTFQDHAAALASLLTQYTSLSTKDTVGLLQYIVAKSFPKMLMRIKNPKYSKPFMDALLDVSIVDYYPTHVRTKLSYLDHVILDSVGTTAAQCHIAIPNLEAMAKNREGSVQLYTAETCQEFHLLLCALLRAFYGSLVKLSEYKKSDSEASLRRLVINASFFGEMLRMVVHSSGIDAYLQAISGFLETKCVHPKDKDIVVEKGEEEEEEEEEDMDLRGVQPNTIIDDGSMPKSLSAWEACRDWLRLLVVHFEALTILDRYIDRYNQPTTITIKVIAVPPLEENSMMLTWRTLLKKYYNDTNPPCTDIITTIEALQTDEEDEPPLPDPLHLLPKPIPSTFFKAKFGENSPLSCGSRFGGTNHCETCLASFMSKLGPIPSQFQDDYNSVLEELSTYEPVLGVSKWCCPVCSALLLMLHEGDSEQPSIMRGAHTTVYPCTLPLWLPSEIVDRMVQIFWEKLKKRLVDLCYSTRRMREQAQSTGSERFSLTPNEEGQPPPCLLSKRLIAMLMPLPRK